MDTAVRVQFLDKTDCISHSTNTLVALLRSLSGKYPWERYEPPYPSSYGLNSIPTVLLALALNKLQRLIFHYTKKQRYTNWSPNLWTTRPNNNQQKMTICRVVDFFVRADRRVKLKESKKLDKWRLYQL